jgi:hypothetical protein
MPVASGSFYEWLLGTELDLPSAEKGAYALVVDPDQQWAAAGTTSSRHRVKNNLPGNCRCFGRGHLVIRCNRGLPRRSDAA